MCDDTVFLENLGRSSAKRDRFGEEGQGLPAAGAAGKDDLRDPPHAYHRNAIPHRLHAV